MRLVWGEPRNYGEMNFRTSTLFSKDCKGGMDQWVVHPIRQWFGVTFRDGIFVGVVCFDARKAKQTPATRAALDAEGER